MNKATLIKIGGNELEDTQFVMEFAEAITQYQQEQAYVVVHGGGRAINQMLEAVGIEPQYVNGQRVTDNATLEIAEMVLSGSINKRLVMALLSAGTDAIGISGVDRKLLQVEPWGENMNLVGRIVEIRTELLEEYFSNHVVPVISPISIGPEGRYNVNADHAAGMISGDIKAKEAIFVSNVPGVLYHDEIIAELSKEEVQTLIEEGHIHGGMIPKVNAAIAALENGAQKAVITNLSGFKNRTGTSITAGKELA